MTSQEGSPGLGARWSRCGDSSPNGTPSIETFPLFGALLGSTSRKCESSVIPPLYPSSLYPPAASPLPQFGAKYPGGFPPLVCSRIGHNNLEGDLPRFWNKLSSLETLELADNKLDGRLPDIWSNMQSLVTIDLAQNRLAGNLPREWENGMPNLRKIDLQKNEIRGDLQLWQKRGVEVVV
mmetsp:Transcript_26660/g.74870  ORF Transcript_26660/g.74870 Transcript_26660/m.74870 type:complete len:180 (+) Transcript_26660:303-842(+)